MTVSVNVHSLSLIYNFLPMAHVTTHEGHRRRIVFSTGSGDFSQLGLLVIIALTTTGVYCIRWHRGILGTDSPN